MGVAIHNYFLFNKVKTSALSAAAAVFMFCGCIFPLAGPTLGQSSPPDAVPKPTPNASPSPSPTPKVRLEGLFIKHILSDQKAIWTFPFRLHGKDIGLLAAFGAATAGLIATDPGTSAWVRRHERVSAISDEVSSLGTVFATGGVAAAFYIVGRKKGDWRARETGVLAAEALIDSGIVIGVVKHVTQRPKPNLDGGRGRFFKGGMSFPSGHSASAWSVATVIAYEYQDKPIVHYGAYAAAVAVSLSRYSGRTHFISEVLVGSAIGFYTGRFVYKTRHVVRPGIDVDNKRPNGEITKAMPRILPLYDAHSKTYGVRALWTF